MSYAGDIFDREFIPCYLSTATERVVVSLYKHKSWHPQPCMNNEPISCTDNNRNGMCRNNRHIKPKIPLGSSRLVTTLLYTFDVSSPCILAVSNLNSTARHARLDSWHIRHVERVESRRNVTWRDETMEFGLHLKTVTSTYYLLIGVRRRRVLVKRTSPISSYFFELSECSENTVPAKFYTGER